MRLIFLRIVFIAGVGLLTATALLSCAKQNTTDEGIRKTLIMGNQSLVLAESEIKTLGQQALRGSPDAAMRLFLFYKFVQQDYAESLFWIRIATENGDPDGEYNLGFMLRDDPDPRNRQRARFWLERAAKHGEPLAEDLLKELP